MSGERKNSRAPFFRVDCPCLVLVPCTDYCVIARARCRPIARERGPVLRYEPQRPIPEQQRAAATAATARRRTTTPEAAAGGADVISAHQHGRAGGQPLRGADDDAGRYEQPHQYQQWRQQQHPQQEQQRQQRRQQWRKRHVNAPRRRGAQPSLHRPQRRPARERYFLRRPEYGTCAWHGGRKRILARSLAAAATAATTTSRPAAPRCARSGARVRFEGGSASGDHGPGEVRDAYVVVEPKEIVRISATEYCIEQFLVYVELVRPTALSLSTLSREICRGFS